MSISERQNLLRPVQRLQVATTPLDLLLLGQQPICMTLSCFQASNRLREYPGQKSFSPFLSCELDVSYFSDTNGSIVYKKIVLYVRYMIDRRRIKLY